MSTTERRRADDLSGDELHHAGVFGFCPDCHREPAGYVNIGRGHWFYCPDCRTRWLVGSNLFSTWRDETVDEQRRKAAFFYEKGYREVESYTPPALQMDAMQGDERDPEGAARVSAETPVDGDLPF